LKEICNNPGILSGISYTSPKNVQTGSDSRYAVKRIAARLPYNLGNGDFQDILRAGGLELGDELVH
jgi:hypothetical protein